MRNLALAGVACLAACSSSFPWVAEAKRVGFTDEDVKRLERDRFLVTGETFPQVFTPYVEWEMPVFVTADSLLHAFHVLLEASFLRVELRNARELPGALREWLDVLTRPSPVPFGAASAWEAARERARRIVAVALRLSEDAAPIPGDLREIVDTEAARVVAARGISKSEWLGPSDADFQGLDYVRFRPQGFYASSDELRRYFRAMMWLQVIPFRVRIDEELLAFVALADTLQEYTDKHTGRLMKQFCDRLKPFIPRGIAPDLLRNRWSIPWMNRHLEDWPTLESVRQSIKDDAQPKPERIRGADLLRWKTDDGSDPGHYRIVAPAWNQELEVFAATGRPGFLPSGADVAAWLGDRLALEALEVESRDKIAGLPRWVPGDAAGDYLGCLAALADGPEPDAPPFMFQRAWSHKALNAILAGWAQCRHTLALHGAPWVNIFGGYPSPAGFVEPEPEFYARMGRLAGKLGSDFSETRRAVPDLNRLVLLLRKSVAILDQGPFTPERNRLLDEVFEEAYSLEVELHRAAGNEGAMALFAANCRVALAQAEDGRVPNWQPARFQIIQDEAELEPLWKSLEALCVHLEALAHKQLRRVEMSAADRAMIRSYGRTLKNVMLFLGDSFRNPPHARPKISTVAVDPASGLRLQVAIGRAQAIYVLYPSTGGDVLCRGSVIPYYEVHKPEPLNDDEWGAILDSTGLSAPWLEPLRTSTKTNGTPKED